MTVQRLRRDSTAIFMVVFIIVKLITPNTQILCKHITQLSREPLNLGYGSKVPSSDDLSVPLSENPLRLSTARLNHGKQMEQSTLPGCSNVGNKVNIPDLVHFCYQVTSIVGNRGMWCAITPLQDAGNIVICLCQKTYHAMIPIPGSHKRRWDIRN